MGGGSHQNVAELSKRIAAACETTGIGLTLLPVYYEFGGCDGRPLQGGQLRFKNDIERYEALYAGAERAISHLPSDANIGIAPHSLRAVGKESLKHLVAMAPKKPFHIHIAEQLPEIEEVQREWGARPVEWLFDNHDVNERWCLIHATHMTSNETQMMAKSGAVAGLCPITESSLGDGIFNGVEYLQHGGCFGVGSDSNILISQSEELRVLEYSQRLKTNRRAVIATPDKSTGRVLLEGAAKGGARAIGRNCGEIKVGQLADFYALNGDTVELKYKMADRVLDSFIFAGTDRLISDVWSAGRHVVKQGKHIKRDAIIARYLKAVERLN